MKWKDLRQFSWQGGDVETRHGGKITRGRTRLIQVKGGVVTIYVHWVVVFDPIQGSNLRWRNKGWQTGTPFGQYTISGLALEPTGDGGARISLERGGRWLATLSRKDAEHNIQSAEVAGLNPKKIRDRKRK